MFDNDFPLRHVDGTLPKRHGGDHGQKLRRQADGESDGEEQRVEGVVVPDDTDEGDEEDEEEDGLQGKHAEAAQAPLELRLRWARGETHDDAAEGRAWAGGGDEGGGGAADDRGAAAAPSGRVRTGRRARCR